MPGAIEHFSRYRLEDTTLQVMADTRRDLDRLIDQEQSVIRHYLRVGSWPHKRINMFVLDDLKPLVAQIKSAAALSSVVADDIDRRPMVNVYDASDLAECAVFVNRGALKRDGVWNDEIALRAMLAHEHAHPLAENETVRAARALSVEVAVEEGAPKKTIGPVLQLLADRLCVHAPQEVFANEVAIRADFADALLHLDKSVIDKAALGVSRRSSLVQSLEQQAAQRKLSAEQAAGLLLVGDLQAHLPFALETAPFLRAGRRRHADALEAALIAPVLARLDPAALRLYGKFRAHYLELRTNLTAAQTKDWSRTALGFLAEALRERSLEAQFALVARRSAQAPADEAPADEAPADRKPPQGSALARATASHGLIDRQGRVS